MIFFVRSLGCLISPPKSIINFSCVHQCPLQYSAWPHSHGAVGTLCSVSLGPLSVLVFTSELRRVFLILNMWRALQILQLITTPLQQSHVTAFLFDLVTLLSTPVAKIFIIFSSLSVGDEFQTIQKKNCQNL
jgi:hypothetical protein